MDFLVLIVGMNDKEILQITTKQESLSSLGILICMKNDIVDRYFHTKYYTSQIGFVGFFFFFFFLSHGKWAFWRGVCGCAGRKMHVDFLVLIVGMNDKEILQITTKQESLSSIGNIDLYVK